MNRLCEKVALSAVQFVPFVNGFCLALRRAAIERIGLFDEVNFPIGYGEEDDLCLRAADAGYVCGIVTNAYVFHVKSASFTPERRKFYVAAGAKALDLKHTKNRIAMASAAMRYHPGLRTVRERLSVLQRMNSLRR